MAATNLLSLSIGFSILETSWSQHHPPCGLLWLASAAEHSVLEVRSRRCAPAAFLLRLNDVPLCGRIAFCSLVDRRLGHFHFLAITNSAARNIRVQNFVRTYVFIHLGYISRSRIATSHGNSMLNCLKKCQTVVHQCTRVPTCPCPCQHLLVPIFFITAILVGVK